MKRQRFSTPDQAETAFYEAFERGDADAMMQVWADDDGIVCVHPMGERLVGRDAVEDSWRRILGRGSSMGFTVTDGQYAQDGTIAVHCVHENIAYGPGRRQHALVIATNVYRLTSEGWRMVMHHASPTEAAEQPAEVPPTEAVH